MNNEELSLRTGVSIGSGIGGLTTIQDNAANLATRGLRKSLHFSYLHQLLICHLSCCYEIWLGPILQLQLLVPGTHSIGYGARTIAYGDADVMICGGTEKGSCALGAAILQPLELYLREMMPRKGISPLG